MRKLYALLLAMALVLGIAGTAAAAETGMPLSGVAALTEDTLVLTLTAEQTNVSGTMTLEYDPQVLTFQEVETAGTLESLLNGQGTVTFGYALETSQAVEAGETVATVTFTRNTQDFTMVEVLVETWNETSGMDLYVSVPSQAGQTRFLDVPVDAWFYDHVEYVAQRDIMEGVGDRLFAPNEDMTRAMFVTTLGRMAGVQAGEYAASGFQDVAEDSWYTPYVNWAAAVGVTTGLSETEFAPNAKVTREQAATFLYRFGEVMGMDLTAHDALTFADADSVSGWAKQAVQWAASAGLMEGWDGNFHPKSAATRAQAAALLQRLDQMMG